MSTKNDKIKSNIIGLDIGLAFGRFFLNTEDLHYGYWPKNEKPSVKNFSWAQENHSNLIIENIPTGVKNILDVGSGSGNLAMKLLEKKYDIDCVIPSEYLADAIREKLNDRGKIHICKFEDLEISNKYDIIIFSESFQYVKMEESIKKISKMLNKNGYLLICDFFRLNVPEKSLLGGGHSWGNFNKEMETINLELIKNIDITNATAPTLDFLDEFCQQVLKPVGEMSGEYMLSNYPKISKLLRWKFKNRINKINKRYLSSNVNGKSFKKFKTYRFLLYKLY